jgi:hypothetical protein
MASEFGLNVSFAKLRCNTGNEYGRNRGWGGGGLEHESLRNKRWDISLNSQRVLVSSRNRARPRRAHENDSTALMSSTSHEESERSRLCTPAQILLTQKFPHRTNINASFSAGPGNLQFPRLLSRHIFYERVTRHWQGGPEPTIYIRGVQTFRIVGHTKINTKFTVHNFKVHIRSFHLLLGCPMSRLPAGSWYVYNDCGLDSD